MKSKEQKRTEAAIRNEKWQKLSPKEQLEHLNEHGLRALKQRKQLQYLLGREKCQ